MTHPGSASNNPAAHGRLGRFLPSVYLLGPLALLSLAMWLYPPAKIYDSAGQRVGAESVPNGDRRIARRYRENQSASFKVERYGRYKQAPDDSRVLIEIALLWLLVAGGAMAWRHWNKVPLRGSAPPVPSDDSDKMSHQNGDGAVDSFDPLAPVGVLSESLSQSRLEEGTADSPQNNGEPGGNSPSAEQSLPAPPTYDRLTPEQRKAAILELKRAMDSGHLQLGPETLDQSPSRPQETLVAEDAPKSPGPDERQEWMLGEEEAESCALYNQSEGEEIDEPPIPGYVESWRRCRHCAHFERYGDSLGGNCSKFGAWAHLDGACPTFEGVAKLDEINEPSIIVRVFRSKIAQGLTKVGMFVAGCFLWIGIFMAGNFLLKGPRPDLPYVPVSKEDYCVADLPTLDIIRLLKSNGYPDAANAIADKKKAIKFSPAADDSVPILDWDGDNVRIEIRPSWYRIGGVSCWMDIGSLETSIDPLE